MDAKERNRIRTASRRASLTPDQKQKQKEIQRVRALERRRNESLAEKLLRRERERQNASKRRLSEPPEKREERLKVGRERAMMKRRGESPASRERRLRKSRERLAMRRKLIREGKRIDDLRKGPRQQFNESKMDTCLVDGGLGNNDGMPYYKELLLHVQSVSDHLPLVIASCSTESYFNTFNKVHFGNLEPFSQDIESETNTLERLLTMSKSPVNPQTESRVCFDEFCKQNYIDESRLYDDTVCKEIGERVMHFLKGKPTPGMEQDPFYIWVKKKGFALTSYPHLGLREVLCVPVLTYSQGDCSTSWRRVAYVEEFYDIISKFHSTKSGHHVGVNKTLNEVSKHYEGVPLLAVEKYVELCSVCRENPVTMETNIEKSVDKPKHVGKNNCFMKKGQIEVIDIHDKPLGSFPLIGLYIDVWSNYHILFPLPTPINPQMEIAINLRKCVFPYFGMPHSLCSALGPSFVDTLLEAVKVHWPDAVVINNGCKQQKESVARRAHRSKSLISDLFESCRTELQGVELTPSSCADLLLSLQYQLNTSSSKNRKCAYELVFGRLPYCGPENQSTIKDSDISTENSENEEQRNSKEDPNIDQEKENVKNTDKTNLSQMRKKSTQFNEMNRLLQKSSSQQSSRQLQQMLSLSSIQAQEQQVTSLRELLRQEEDRLEMLKKMRGSSPSETGETIRGGVIRSNESVGSHVLNNGSQSISSRLQQLVDSVAVDQIGSNYSHNSHVSSRKNDKQFNSGSPEVITISDSPSPASPPALISTNHVPGVIQVPTIASSHSVKLDEAAILKTIENSRRYRDFIMKQSNLKRNFQKQIDKKIANAPYPKTFRQVWPIIPVQDPSFVKNLGLETVTQFFEQGTHTKSPPVSKVKPICNQCGCDFASAWQIRKNNAKQVLLCESCDFTNLKLLQRTKLATQLKEIVENIRKDEEKFNTDCEDARKQIIALERSSILSSAQKSLNNKASNNGSQAHANHVTTRHTVVDVTKSNEMKRPTIPSILTSRGGFQIQERVYSTLETSRKRPSDQDYAAPSRKSPKTSSNLDHTLSRITQQLLRKQVDEKVQQHRQQHSPSPTPHVMTTKTPPPPLEQMDVRNHTPSPNPPEPKVLQSTPPPLTSVSCSGGDNRRSRRKGQPRQNRQLSSSSDI